MKYMLFTLFLALFLADFCYATYYDKNHFSFKVQDKRYSNNHSQRNNLRGWPWYLSNVPPSKIEDCVTLYYGCTDYEQPGWPGNEKKCYALFKYCDDFIEQKGQNAVYNKFFYKVPLPESTTTTTTTLPTTIITTTENIAEVSTTFQPTTMTSAAELSTTEAMEETTTKFEVEITTEVIAVTESTTVESEESFETTTLSNKESTTTDMETTTINTMDMQTEPTTIAGLTTETNYGETTTSSQPIIEMTTSNEISSTDHNDNELTTTDALIDTTPESTTEMEIQTIENIINEEPTTETSSTVFETTENTSTNFPSTEISATESSSMESQANSNSSTESPSTLKPSTENPPEQTSSTKMPVEEEEIVGLPDQCFSYKILDNSTRSINYNESTLACDKAPEGDWKGPGFYRFQAPAGLNMAHSPPGSHRCGTDASGWYSGVIPENSGDVVEGKICFQFLKTQCQWEIPASITHCGSYFVYYLTNTLGCKLRYCGTNDLQGVFNAKYKRDKFAGLTGTIWESKKTDFLNEEYVDTNLWLTSV